MWLDSRKHANKARAVHFLPRSFSMHFTQKALHCDNQATATWWRPLKLRLCPMFANKSVILRYPQISNEELMTQRSPEEMGNKLRSWIQEVKPDPLFSWSNMSEVKRSESHLSSGHERGMDLSKPRADLSSRRMRNTVGQVNASLNINMGAHWVLWGFME